MTVFPIESDFLSHSVVSFLLYQSPSKRVETTLIYKASLENILTFPRGNNNNIRKVSNLLIRRFRSKKINLPDYV